MNNQVAKFAAAALLAACFTVPAVAQSAGSRMIRTIDRYFVKPGHLDDFRAAQREIVEILTKAGYDKAETWWMAGSGPDEVVRVRYHNGYAGLDFAEEPKLKEHYPALRAAGIRMSLATDRRERIVDEIMADQSLPASAEPPRMARVVRTVVKPEKMAEYLAMTKAELLPAAKKAGLKTYQVSRTRYGGSAFEIRSVTGMSKWAEQDRPIPIVEAMGGSAEYQKFLARRAPLILENEITMYSYMGRLSYTPAASGSATGGSR